MNKKNTQIVSMEMLLATVKSDFHLLSPQLKRIGLCIEKIREQIAMTGIQALAEQCSVQPSAIVRFAKHFGFKGYSELQAIFKADAWRQLSPATDYHSRIRKLIQDETSPLPSSRLAREVITASMNSLDDLGRTFPDGDFDRAVNLLLEAPSIWLAAARRSFPVGAYLAYSLQHTDKPIHWLNGVGLMQHDQLNALAENDVMIAVSFEPYAQETLAAIDTAIKKNAKVILLTDSQFSEVAKLATISLRVQDGATFGFRSLTTTLCLAQSLFLALAYKMELSR